MTKYFWVLLTSFIILLGLWIWQEGTYPHPVYDIRYTGEVIDYYDQRQSGLEVVATPIMIPDNPFWVDIMRNGLFRIFLLMAFPIYLLYMLTQYLDKREATKRLARLEEFIKDRENRSLVK